MSPLVPLDIVPRTHSSAPRSPAHPSSHRPQPALPPCPQHQRASLPARPTSTPASRYVRPRGLRTWNLFKQLLPVLAWGATTLAFFLAIAFWRTELFDGPRSLPRSSSPYAHPSLSLPQHSIVSHTGCDRTSTLATPSSSVSSFSPPSVCPRSVFVPPPVPADSPTAPLPLYSTLITLSGYTFGPWTGAMISYTAALSGALVVFLLARTFLRDAIARWLQSSRPLARAVHAIERRPSLLFLVRLAPYPYNVLNALLAACPTLALRTYTLCTALSLIKVIVHTSIGAGIRSFAAGANGTANADGEEGWARGWTVGGIVLCVALFVYLSWVARRAVDDELDGDGDVDDAGAEERVAFLGPDGVDGVDGDEGGDAEMQLPRACARRESNMSEAYLVPARPLAAR